MRQDRQALPTRRDDVSFWLLAGFLILLWVAGGASRPDVVGQVFTRAGAWALALIIVAIRLPVASRDLKAPAILLGAAILLPAIQLIPLPPAIWTHLPGRALLQPGGSLTGQNGLWRPLSISPGWTRNALGSLIVPSVCLALIAGMRQQRDVGLLRLLLALIVGGCLLASVQIANPAFDHPLINDVLGQISGNFANRNHMALFASIGCALAPVWAARDHALKGWGVSIAAALVALFVLVILATGSRAGILLGGIGIASGILAAFGSLKRVVATVPTRKAWVAALGVLAAFAAVVAVSLLRGKAEGIDRALELSAQDDVRVRVLPTVLEMLRTFFPAGSGFGTFDPAFRIFESDELLGPSFYNQAHNDLLQVGLDGGAVGFALLFGTLAWWAVRSFSAWRAPDAMMRRAGSAALLLIIVASAFDYPARTPIIMAVMMIAAGWLARRNIDPIAPTASHKSRPSRR